MMTHLRLSNAIGAAVFKLLFGHRFARLGRGSRIVAPVAIERPDRIVIGDGVYVAAATCLAVSPNGPQADQAVLAIGDGSKIGRFNHIYACTSVRIGKKVLTANGVYISDNLHGHKDPAVPIMDQPLEVTSAVEIGDGSWLGHNACVIGARLGRHCVVGANAVVTRDAPDHSVLVGAPARIIKRYDPAVGQWRKTSPDGEFEAN